MICGRPSSSGLADLNQCNLNHWFFVKKSSDSWVFQAFPEPQTYFSIGYCNKSNCNNDLHQGSYDPVYLVNSCFTLIFEWRTKNTFCYNFSPRLHRIPWAFYVQRNPWVFQVFQVCGHRAERWCGLQIRCIIHEKYYDQQWRIGLTT